MNGDDICVHFHPDHWTDLCKSGLSPETIQSLGLYSARPADIPKLIGWAPEGVTSALVFPYPYNNGFCRVKVFPSFRDNSGHENRYLQRKGSGVHIYVPPLAHAVRHDPSVDWSWAEGEKKAGKACQEGIICAGIGGLWNWIEENQAISDLDTISHNGRHETIYPDSDVWERDDLLKAVYAFGRELQARGAVVQIGILPAGNGNGKVGLDDFLLAHTAGELQALVHVTLKDKRFKGLATWWRGWHDKKLQAPLTRQVNVASPYRVTKEGCTVYLSQTKSPQGKASTEPVLIADFTAVITGEQINEDGSKVFVIDGATVHGRAFHLDVPAQTFSDERQLKALLTEAAGADAPIYSGMHRHLPAAIQKLSKPQMIKRTKRYIRTGWAGEHFLIPGREPADTTIILPRKLPYAIDPHASLETGLKVLRLLLTCMPGSLTTVPVAMAFEAPIAHMAGWRGERYGVAIRGQSGSLKTSWSQVLMSLYGPGFLSDELILKMGQGATSNAIMALAAQAHDLPFFIDNYKPSTGGGAREFINLIHNILEGGEKERLSRAAELRETKPVFCWPLITGEDMPDTDPATLARLLVVRFTWQQGTPNHALAQAQDDAAHLCSVGRAWLSWIESAAGHEAIKEVAKDFHSSRSSWAESLRKSQHNMVNALRVASNLASNELTWHVMTKHPTIGPIIHEHRAAHYENLGQLAGQMAAYTTTALEANKFLEILRELLASGRAILQDRQAPSERTDPDRMIGWKNTDGTANILPSVARNLVDRLSPESLGAVSGKTLYGQIADRGLLASSDRGKHEKTIKIEGHSYKTIHLAAHALTVCEGE
jgi:Domain of unknown function (DUF927)/Domain of unknown function (DUF3854)